MISAFNLLTSTVHSLTLTNKRGHPLWPGSRFTNVDCSRAAYRGLRFIYRTALDKKNFMEHGDDYLWCFYTISSSVKDPKLRRLARSMGVERARQWRLNHRILRKSASANAVITFASGHDAAASLGVPDDKLKPQLERVASRYSARDFLKFDPRREPPPDDVPDPCDYDKADNPLGSTVCRVCKRPLSIRSRYDVWYEALTTTYIGDRIGVTLGAHYDDVFRWLPLMRPYRASENGTNQEFEDIVYAITHIVYTLNDYNAYKLLPDWLPQEYECLKANLHEAISQEDDDMLGEMMDALRAFGLTNDDEEMQAGIEYLLAHQNADGSWGTTDENDAYDLYHPTWGAITALSELATEEYSSRLETTPYTEVISLEREPF